METRNNNFHGSTEILLVSIDNVRELPVIMGQQDNQRNFTDSGKAGVKTHFMHMLPKKKILSGSLCGYVSSLTP